MGANEHTKTEETAEENSHYQQGDADCELAALPDAWDEWVANGTLPDLVQ